MHRYVRWFITNPLTSNQRIKSFDNCTTNRSFVREYNVYRRANIKGTINKKAFTIDDLLQHINKGNLFYLKKLTNVFHTIDFRKLKSVEAILLLKCSSSVPDSSREQRKEVCKDIFTGLQKNNNINIDVYNTYLKTCTENNYYINYEEFLSALKCDPTEATYKLLLENACQHGKIGSAMSILELMKARRISLDLDIFNNLVLAHSMEGGLSLAETVLKTMRSAYIDENKSTRLAILIGLIKSKNFEDFKKAVAEYPLKLNEHEVLCLIEELGVKGIDAWLPQIYTFYKDMPITRDFQSDLEKKCIHIIHMGHPVSAMNIYKQFLLPVPELSYGNNLLKEMLHCNIDTDIIISLAKDLVDNNYNEYILENLTELALKFRYIEQSLALLCSLKTVRPHYFWPLLVHEGGSNGEKGVFSVLEKMKQLNVRPDAETFETYIIPFCDLSNPKHLISKLNNSGFSVKEILSPLLTVLLGQKKIKQAENICSFYEVKISGNSLFELLSKSWVRTKDTLSVLTLLQRYSESNIEKQDLVGHFLMDCFKMCKSSEDFEEFVKLSKLIRDRRLRISTYSYNVLLELSKNCSNDSLRHKIEANMNSLLDLSIKLTEEGILTHPRNMDLVGLECHLIELQEKRMETRGLLRRLIQTHANIGNLERVKELRQLFLDSGYEETVGIKSSVMHSFIVGGHVDEALTIYKELKNFDVEFRMDSFKFIDLAKLLIAHDRFEEGYNILQNETSHRSNFGNTQSIVRNCRDLLNSCKTAEEVQKVFSLLLKAGLCKPINIILGPLVKIYLKSGDLNKAVETYIELAQKYHCTPLQLEILCSVTKQENSDLLQKVVKATEAVHGSGPTHVGLISALAENGQEKSLRKTLCITSVSIKSLLEKRCERWVKEGKMDPLKCLLKASHKISEDIISVEFIYKCILELYELEGDFDGAMTFYESIPEEFSHRLSLTDYLNRIQAKHNLNVNNNVEIRNTI